MRLPIRVSLISAAIVAVVALSGIVRSPRSSTPVTTSAAPTAQAAGTTGASASGVTMDTTLFRTIARRQNPTVVAIMTRSRIQVTNPFEDDDLFRWFFGRPPARQDDRIQRGLGSGFVIGRSGEILTNNHVVADAEVIEVALMGTESRTYRATVKGRDPLSDSALIVLQQPPADLPVATLGDSDQLAPGDWVMAIGNPFQLGHTVTVGVVSYQGRPFEVAEGRWQNMIQTDASINPGNSGGPLINVRGEVVGINAAILGSETGGSIGIGFAVPINGVKTLLPQLRQGKVVRGRIGVQLRGGFIADDEAKALALPRSAGAIVTAVEPGSPADRAGLQAGDVIVEFNGKPITTADDLIPQVSATAPGTRVQLTVMRNGQERSLRITVEALALEEGRGAATRARDSGGNFGLALDDLTPAISRQLRLPPGMDGAIVAEVATDGAADRAGLQPGDVIREVNRQPVHTAAEAGRALQGVQAGQPVFVLLWRDGNNLFVQMRKD
jgi:serine protease Do